MSDHHRVEAKQLLGRLYDMLQDRSTDDVDLAEVWQTKIKDHEITTIMTEINRILRWSHGDESLEVSVLRTIKQNVLDATSGYIESSWRQASRNDISTLLMMIEAVCVNTSVSQTQENLALS